MSEELEAISVRLPKSIVEKIDYLCTRNQFKVSRTSMIKVLLTDALKEYRYEPEPVGKAVKEVNS